VNGTCYDQAGNSASATVSGINIDKTPPTLNPSVSPNPATLNGSATASPNATDGLSGIDTQSCGALDLASVGSKTVNCTAADKAGNTANASVFKQKSTVPTKFRVCDANGVSISTPVVTSYKIVAAVSGVGSVTYNEDPVSTTPDTVFRWSSTDQQWIFNTNTKGMSANVTYYFEIKLLDGTSILFNYGLK
jgi:hypothetical protein